MTVKSQLALETRVDQCGDPLPSPPSGDDNDKPILKETGDI